MFHKNNNCSLDYKTVLVIRYSLKFWIAEIKTKKLTLFNKTWYKNLKRNLKIKYVVRVYKCSQANYLIKTTSAFKVRQIVKKSAQMKSILSATPYICALCLAYSNFTGSMSMAITVLFYTYIFFLYIK